MTTREDFEKIVEVESAESSELEAGSASVSAHEDNQVIGEENRRSGRRSVAALGLTVGFVALISVIALGAQSQQASVQAGTQGVTGAINFVLAAPPPGTSAYQPDECVYNLKDARNSLYMNVDGGKKENEANVQLWDNPNSGDSRWKITKTGDSYTIANMNDKSFVLNLASGGESSKNVQIFNNADSPDSKWQFFKVDDSANVLLKNMNGDFFLSASGDEKGANVEASTDPAGQENQWALELPNGVCSNGTSDDAPPGTNVSDLTTPCTYTLKHVLSTLYLNNQGGVVKNENNVQLYSDANSTHNHWVLNHAPGTADDAGIYTLGAADGPSFVVNLAGGGKVPGLNNIQLYNNADQTDSQWEIFGINGSNGYYLLKNMNGNYYLSADGTNAEANVAYSTSPTGAEDQWQITPVGACPVGPSTPAPPTTTSTSTLPAPPSGTELYKPNECTYALKSVSSNLYANVDGGNTENGVNVQLWDNPNSTHSQWTIAAISGVGDFTIQSVNSLSKYMNLAGGGEQGQINVQIWDNANSAHSQWFFYKVGEQNSTVLIMNKQTRNVLSTAGGNLGSNVYTEVPNALNDAQKFELVPVGTCVPV
jgi:hypothetical protein